MPASLYILAAVLLISAGVSTCNYVQKVNAVAEVSACREDASRTARELAEANLKAIEDNAVQVAKLQHEAEEKVRAAAASYTKAKEEIRALKNRKPVPVECVSHCRNDFEPVARVVDGMRSPQPQH